MKLRAKYQLILLGHKNKYEQQILETFFKHLVELGIDQSNVETIRPIDYEEKYQASSPTFCLYFGRGNEAHPDLAHVKELRKDANLILPIVESLKTFGEAIPKLLESVNGFELNGDLRVEPLVANILEGFSLLRLSRRIFISYRRDEATGVAIQLFELLEKNGFEVFLDTHSIAYGEEFQEELWHRMVDTDVVVALNSPGFYKSTWTELEFAKANALSIGILQLIWPENALEREAELSDLFFLKKGDFVDDGWDVSRGYLDDSCEDRIVAQVEALRARSLASRQDNLVTEFVLSQKRRGIDVNLQWDKTITKIDENAKKTLVIPVVGIPQSFIYNKSEELKEKVEHADIEKIQLLYDHRNIRDKWLKHLKWLDCHLPIKAIKLAEEKEGVKRSKINRPKIFLSASIPKEKDTEFFETADVVAIRDSVRALATVVVPFAHLIWGGHPAITPLIRYVVDKSNVSVKEHVTLYQSAFFTKDFPKDNERFEDVRITPIVEDDQAKSLSLMRKNMIEDNDFDLGIFIGGKEGVLEEYEAFKKAHPKALILPIGSTGAAAAKLVKITEQEDNYELNGNYAYMAVFKELLKDYLK